MDGYMRSKIPLKLVLIAAVAVAVNFALVVGLQLLLNYRVSGPIDETALAALDEAYEGCTILDHTENTADRANTLHVYLVKTQDGSEHLVTIRKHYLLDRYRLMKSACQPLLQGEDTVRLRAGASTFYLNVNFNPISGHQDISWNTWIGQHPRVQFRNNMTLCITGLCILELAVWGLIFRKEEMA